MRDYDPTTGRYLQADPLGLVAGASVYGYALQNPMYWTDPTGQCPWCLPAAVYVGFIALDYYLDEGCYTWGDFAFSVVTNLDPFKVTKLWRAYKYNPWHVIKRHVTRSKFPHKGKYRKPSEIRKLQDKTVSKPDRVIDQGNRIRFERDFGRDIGTNGQRTHVVVVDKATREIVTSFPLGGV